MIAAAFAANLRRYEFLGAPEPYKLLWTDQLHDWTRLQLFPRSLGGRLEHLAWSRGRDLVTRLRRR